MRDQLVGLVVSTVLFASALVIDGEQLLMVLVGGCGLGYFIAVLIAEARDRDLRRQEEAR